MTKKCLKLQKCNQLKYFSSNTFKKTSDTENIRNTNARKVGSVLQTYIAPVSNTSIQIWTSTIILKETRDLQSLVEAQKQQQSHDSGL